MKIHPKVAELWQMYEKVPHYSKKRREVKIQLLKAIVKYKSGYSAITIDRYSYKVLRREKMKQLLQMAKERELL